MRVSQVFALASLLFGIAQAVPAIEPKRKVAYWSIYDAEQGAEKADLTQLDGLTHLVLFGVDMRTRPLAMASSSRHFPTDIAEQAKRRKIKLMGAFGGWDQDDLFFTETDDKQGSKEKAIQLGKEIAALAIKEKWDGIDLDHEYPNTTTSTHWPEMVKAIKLAAPKMLLSLAMPGRPYNTPGADPLEHVMSGYKTILSRIDKHVDFYNVMTYDLLNRYSQGQEAYHHSYLEGMQNAIADLEALGVKKDKINVGFTYYAKWFPITQEPCTQPSGLNCILDYPLTDYNCGSLRYETTHNQKHELVLQDAWTGAVTSFKDYVNIIGETAESPGKFYDEKNKADSYYDDRHKIFWTWQSPHSIKETCEALKNIQGLGGQFVFSLGGDRKDMAHHEAWKTCIKGW